jgi:hypothetical protein
MLREKRLMDIATSQLEAARKGQKKFFTGKPCKKGHTAFRYTHGGSCVKCAAESTVRQRELIKELMANKG